MDNLIDFFINIFLSYIWNNVIFLHFLFILLIIILYLICLKKNEVYNLFFTLTYNDLCLKIGTILNKNKNLWREFRPNSSMDSEKEGLICVEKFDRTKGVIDKNNNVIIPFGKYNYSYQYSCVYVRA